jgi:hypothetical protein
MSTDVNSLNASDSSSCPAPCTALFPWPPGQPRGPRASIVVAAPVGEVERWVSVAGRATVEPDGAHDLAEDWVRVVIHPQSVSRYAMH